jgi:hypothetical protein
MGWFLQRVGLAAVGATCALVAVTSPVGLGLLGVPGDFKAVLGGLRRTALEAMTVLVVLPFSATAVACPIYGFLVHRQHRQHRQREAALEDELEAFVLRAHLGDEIDGESEGEGDGEGEGDDADVPERPHPRDARVDDACPICREHLVHDAGVELSLAVRREDGAVLVRLAPRALAKCRRCGSVAHADCVARMMAARARAAHKGGACAVCVKVRVRAHAHAAGPPPA